MNAGRDEYDVEGGGVTIYVEGDFIGEIDYIEGIMKKYDLHVKPAKQKARGLEKRKISSMSGIGR